MKKIFLLLCCFALFASLAFAQSRTDGLGKSETQGRIKNQDKARKLQRWSDILENIAEAEDVDQGSLEQLYEELEELSIDKIDINSCTREDLLRLPFLSEQQVMDIMEYLYKARRMESPMEFYLIPSLDRRTILLLQQFITYSPAAPADTVPSLRNVVKYGKHELAGDFHLPFYERKGDKNGYLGYKYKHWLRYTFRYRQQVKFGLVASQDAGEPFFAGRNSKGYDFYSFYLLLRDMRRLKALAIGRYRLRFGMGLILNNNFSYGKIASLTNLYASSNHIFQHSSRSDANYLQGAAVTIDLGNGFDFTGFVSYRKIDATLNKDSLTVANIVESGYHRTLSEMRRKNNTSQSLFGGNLNFFRNGFHVGATGYYTSFNRQLKMNTGSQYRRWYPVGKSFWNASVDYGYVGYKLNVSGETAMDGNGQVATSNTVSYLLNSRLTLMALQRYYPYKYVALFAESFSEGGNTNDESGVFVGGRWQASRFAELFFYTDISYFPWPKFGTSTATHRWDNFLQLSVTKEKYSLLCRYRLKMRDEDVRQFTHRGRAAFTWAGSNWSLKTQADLAYVSDETNSLGYMLSESGRWDWRWLILRASVGYFHTDDYASRVYGYEPGMFYSFYFPSFSGHGMRETLNVRANVGKKLAIVAKLGVTHYFDRDVISSGLQQINGSTQTDLEIQFKWKFSFYKPKQQQASL